MAADPEDGPSPFVSDVGDIDADETWMDPQDLMRQTLSTSTSTPDAAVAEIGLADEVDPRDDVDIPGPQEYGRGKRRRLLSSRWDDFVAH